MADLRRRGTGTLPSLMLAVGVVLGWGLASSRAPVLRANGGDRWQDSIVATGPAFIRYNEGSKIQVAQDAVYYLDYRSGKLIGTIPTMRQSVGSSKLIDGFAERDLVTDFHIDVDGGARPHFLMTTGSMSQGASSTFGDGWSSLYVVETTTRQMAAYRIQQQQVGTNLQTRLELLELRSFGAPVAAR